MPSQNSTICHHVREYNRKHTQHMLWEQLAQESKRINLFFNKNKEYSDRKRFLVQARGRYRAIVKSRGLYDPEKQSIQMKFFDMCLKTCLNSSYNAPLAISRLQCTANKKTMMYQNNY